MPTLVVVLLFVVAVAAYMWRRRKAHGAPASGPAARRQRNVPPSQLTNTLQVGCDEDHCWFDIVGEASYQGTLRRVAGRRLLEEEDVHVRCIIAPEPDNPHDPGAMAVYIEGAGKVGYFSRDDLAGDYGLLRDRLSAASAVGLCGGRLTGGWEEDVHIGVRLALVRPSELRGESRRERLEAPEGWFLRHRLELPPGKGWLNLVDDALCQTELLRLAEGRDAARETIGFVAALVPAEEDTVIVCTEGGGPVGRLGRGDVARYSELIAHLMSQNAIATCGGWVVPEADRLGARVTLPSPKSVLKNLASR